MTAPRITAVAVVMEVGTSRRTIRVEYLPLDGRYLTESDCCCAKRKRCPHLEAARSTLRTVLDQTSGARTRSKGQEPPKTCHPPGR